ncbi:MAG: NAD-binding protein [Spirochaetota bacterium]|nr:NAD-binding protein [Spirochaetota bacterium]
MVIKKLFHSFIFHFRRKTENFPIKTIFIVFLVVIIIAITESAFFYSTPDTSSESLEILPSEIRFPDSFKNKISYNNKKKLLEFNGKMSDSDKNTLINLSTDEAYQSAIKGIYNTSNKQITIGEGLWWAMVTLTTVGYGDYAPNNPIGRFLAVILMGFGIVFTSVLSGTIASIFVERKLREGRGMKELNIKDHIIICGWNDTAENLVHSLPQAGERRDLSIVLVNEMNEDIIADIKFRHKELDIKFVKGDFTREEVLNRANISRAQSVILLADSSGGHAMSEADQRTIIAAFAIKNMCEDVKVAAELNKKENKEHLKRANVDDTLIYGEFGGFLLSHAALSPGVPSLIMELLSFSVGNTIMKAKIPDDLIGKTFADLGDYFRIKRKAIVIGVLSEEKEMSLDDILSGEDGGIDEFIKKKFSEVEEEYFGGQKPQFHVNINPGNDYIIKNIDVAFIIARG